MAQSSLARATASTAPNSSEVLLAQQTVASAQTTLLNAQNNLQKLLAMPSASDIATAQQAVTAAESQLQTARNNLDKILLGSTPEEIASARAALDSANSALETAQINWDRLESGADLETRQEYTALIAARSDYQSALSAFNLKTKGPEPGDVAVAQSAIDSANSLLSSSLARLEQVRGGSLPTDIGIAREAVSNAELALRQAQKDLDGATISSPIKGTVVSVGVNPGDQVTASTAAFSVLDPELIRVDATVDESNVIRLKQGMPVTVTFDALQGRSFQGIIATVTPAGVTQQGVVTFPVTVVFNSQGFTIPPGTTANLRVVAESKPNVIVVPQRALTRSGRNLSVTVMENGKPVSRPVRTGVTGDGFTEILEGLEEGEIIVTSAQQQTSGTGTFGAGGLPGLGTGAPAPGQPVRR
jgi:RND family efflux transporter MFP subunit